MKQRLTIGVLIGNANSPYSMNLITGIHQEARRQDVDIVYFLGIHNGPAYRAYFGTEEMDDFDYQFNSIYDHVALTQVDALIIDYNSMIAYMDNDAPIKFLEKFNSIPYVLVGDRDANMHGSSVVFNCYQGMVELVEHLVSCHGYQHFAMLSGPLGNRDAMVRKRAVEDVLSRHHIPFGDKQIAYGDFTRMVQDKVNRLLDDNPDLQALICANDFMADTAYSVCQSRGLVVGKDIAITGYDDWANARNMTPPLTTVLQDERALAVRSLLCAMELVRTKMTRVVEMPVDLRIRESCGCEVSVHKPATISIAESKAQSDRLDSFKLESWFVSLIARNMMNSLEDRKQFYHNALAKLSAFRVKNSWLFLYPAPVLHTRKVTWIPPDHLNLVAEQHGTEVTSYSVEEAPILNHVNTVESFCAQDTSHALSVMCLYSGEMQYGILVLDIMPENLALSYLMSIQIANALRYYELFLTQQAMRTTLENLVSEIQEKNEVLNFLSEYDALSGCLNRRGFMERAVSLNHSNIGQEALLLFADLDHLKEINDTFGHAEGDYAIRKVSTIICDALSPDSLVGRMGGDEFVALIPHAEDSGTTNVLDEIRTACDLFNLSSDKPYYIEISLGIRHITFDAGLSIADALKEADESLYMDKLQRRKTVLKPMSIQLDPTQSNSVTNEINSLTGLYVNQNYFRQVDQYIKRINPVDFCLASIDIENFRLFNKWYGRSEGDRLLREVGRLLRDIQEKNGGVAGYLGNDDFSILLPDDRNLLINLQQGIQRSIRHLSRSYGFMPVIGVYRLGANPPAAVNMYDCATMAQNAVTGQYGSFIQYYDDGMLKDREKELVLLSEVKESLDRNEFTIYIQPQCDMTTGEIIGGESLIRWNHPVNGLVMPAQFLPVLEKMSFIADVDRFVWESTCKWIRDWIDRGNKPVPISVNISRVDFFLMDVPRQIQHLLKKYSLPIDTLKIEITETSYAEESTIRSNVDVMRNMGLTVMMDDFGSGYSSMSILHSVQVDVLKIDMKFLALDVLSLEKGHSILRTLISFARQLELPVIVEGIETAEQEDFLRSVGCRFVQGYYYYRPMPVSDFEQILLDRSCEKQ